MFVDLVAFMLNMLFLLFLFAFFKVYSSFRNCNILKRNNDKRNKLFLSVHV